MLPRMAAIPLGASRLLALVLGLGTPLVGATWTGAAATDRWSEPANWDGGQPPGPGDEAIFVAPTLRPARNDLATIRRLVIAAPGVRLAGGPLVVTEEVQALAGDAELDLPLTLAALLARGGWSIAGERLAVVLDGALRLEGGLSGAGGLVARGRGEATFAAASTYRGGTRLAGVTARLAGDVPAIGAGALGDGGEIHLDGATLVQATAVVARGLTVGGGGARLRAEGGARELQAPIEPSPGLGGTLVGTYFPGSRRGQRIDDWRAPGVGAVRADARIAFPGASFGGGEDRRRMGIGGSDADWDDFSVQWDGWLRIDHPGTALATVSDDGSRVWVDLDGDGATDADEWGANGWGRSQAMSERVVHPALAAGAYRFRAQYEEGRGGNGMVLAWSPPQRAGASPPGMRPVPAEAFVIGARIVVEGGDPLTLSGAHGGVVEVVVRAAATVTLRSPVLGRLVVESGTVRCAGPGVLDGTPVDLALSALLAFGGADQRPRSLAGPGTVALDGARCSIPCPEDGVLAADVRGPGTLEKRGPGLLACTGTLDPGLAILVAEGAVLRPDGRVTAALSLATAPLSSRLLIPGSCPGDRVVEVDVEVPAGAPPGLGIGAFAADRHGRWYQRTHPLPLAPGNHALRFVMSADGQTSAASAPAIWDAVSASTCDRSGVFVWAESGSAGSLRLECRVRPHTPPAMATPRLADLRCPDAARTGERWEVSCRPHPFPADPYDAAAFRLEAVVTAPDGGERRLLGFYAEPMRGSDRGDRERVEAAGRGEMRIRWRPTSPGRHRVRLEASWADGRRVVTEAPPVDVAGPAWDGYVRVDPADPRFFSVGDAFHWPIGLNLRSVTDPRSAGNLGTLATPERGTLAYEAYLARFAAAGGTAVEIWLAAWNLGLEWRADWDGFHGVGRYHQGNAWRLDRVLDAAWARGIRVNLVINNHGQASDQADPEWALSPYHRINGGRLLRPREWFVDPWAQAGQERMRRYLIGRYADHPAILGWKLYSEIDLTGAGDQTAAWHRLAVDRWRALDPYGHPCTTHWSSDWRKVEPGVARLDGIGYLCIDAYHGDGTSLADLLWRSSEGLRAFGKPVLVTEYGGTPTGAPRPQMEAELASAAWIAAVGGHAGAPMLWWWEWVDQGERWQPYRAIAAFMRGEDLRGAAANPRVLTSDGPQGRVWSRAWSRPGRMLGYACDPDWVASGADRGELTGVRLDLGAVAAGPMTIAWWDADRGSVRSSRRFDHGGGRLVLEAPGFSRHLGFKLARE
jgi:hypothetical protein